MYQCACAAEQAENAAVLNHAIDQILCEFKSNLDQQCLYFLGKSSQISLKKPNHNVENAPYQLMGGSRGLPAAIENHMFDAMMLKIADITEEAAHKDNEADALVLHNNSRLNTAGWNKLVSFLPFFSFVFLMKI